MHLPHWNQSAVHQPHHPHCNVHVQAAGTKSTPCCKASWAAQWHQPRSTEIISKLSKCRYATTLFKLSKIDHLFVFSLQFTTSHPAPCQNAHPAQWPESAGRPLMVDDWTFGRHGGAGRVKKYRHTLHICYMLYIVNTSLQRHSCTCYLKWDCSDDTNTLPLCIRLTFLCGNTALMHCLWWQDIQWPSTEWLSTISSNNCSNACKPKK